MRKAGGPFLVQRRTRARGALYGGKIGLYGGRREGAETPEQCALREVAEECGVELAAGSLTLLARLLAYDARGHLSYGHIYYADALDGDAVKTARRFRSDEGSLVLLPEREIAQRWGELTSITGYAISVYRDIQSMLAPSKGFGRFFAACRDRSAAFAIGS